MSLFHDTFIFDSKFTLTNRYINAKPCGKGAQGIVWFVCTNYEFQYIN